MAGPAERRYRSEMKRKPTGSPALGRTLRCWLTYGFLLAGPIGSSIASPPLVIGDKAPALSVEEVLQAPIGTDANWHRLRGNVVVIEFWATWCGPCVASIPHWNELNEGLRGEKIRFLSITDEPKEIVEGFLGQMPIRGWVGLDLDGSTFQAFGSEVRPTTIVVDRHGKIAAITEPRKLQVEYLRQLLSGQRPELPAMQEAPTPVRAGELPLDSREPGSALFQVILRQSTADYSRTVSGSSGAYTGVGLSLTQLIAKAYRVPPSRIVLEGEMPSAKYDLVAKPSSTGADHMPGILQQAIEATFGVVVKRERRQMDVYILRAIGPAAALRPTVSTGGQSLFNGPGEWQAVNVSLADVASTLENFLGRVVIDETALTGNYDFDLTWQPAGADDTDRMLAALRTQLNLEVMPGRQEVEVLVVTRANSEGESLGRPAEP
jgi:uncharacterized protein (TIGR03435 family)